MSQTLFITVHSSNESDSNRAALSSPSVAAVDLDIPEDARKEFDKATKTMADKNWLKAQATTEPCNLPLSSICCGV